jgi:hypothetical protein
MSIKNSFRGKKNTNKQPVFKKESTSAPLEILFSSLKVSDPGPLPPPVSASLNEAKRVRKVHEESLIFMAYSERSMFDQRGLYTPIKATDDLNYDVYLIMPREFRMASTSFEFVDVEYLWNFQLQDVLPYLELTPLFLQCIVAVRNAYYRSYVQRNDLQLPKLCTQFDIGLCLPYTISSEFASDAPPEERIRTHYRELPIFDIVAPGSVLVSGSVQTWNSWKVVPVHSDCGHRVGQCAIDVVDQPPTDLGSFTYDDSFVHNWHLAHPVLDMAILNCEGSFKIGAALFPITHYNGRRSSIGGPIVGEAYVHVFGRDKSSVVKDYIHKNALLFFRASLIHAGFSVYVNYYCRDIVHTSVYEGVVKALEYLFPYVGSVAGYRRTPSTFPSLLDWDGESSFHLGEGKPVSVSPPLKRHKPSQ